MNKSTKISTGSKIAVIGGGPAGSSSALYLLHYAKELGKYPEVTIYESRNFDEPGPKGCKGCAGVLSLAAQKNLSELGLTIPENVIQNKIENYTVHSPYTSISLSSDQKEVQIASIYRGGGPRISNYSISISFDDWLLRKAQEQGAKIMRQKVVGIQLGGKVEIELAEGKLEYDLVVLATGINAKPISVLGLNYISPQSRIMALDELYLGSSQVKSYLGNAAHVFLIPNSKIIFGALVPKGAFVNVSVLSTGEHPVSISSFLNTDIVRRFLPDSYERVCGCQRRVAVSPAPNYYTDGFVVIGDAAVSRLYKDGIGSALITASHAAHTAIQHGISYQDFKRYYAPCCHSLNRDNRWGHFLFAVNDKAKDFPSFLWAQHRLIGNEQHDSKGPQPFTKSAWGMFSGNYSYGTIARMVLNPTSVANLFIAMLWEYFTHFFQKGATQPRTLYVGKRRLLILGSGFGGTYTLRYLVPSLNRNENIETTMVSDENFFLFSPLLHEVAMGRIETRHIAYPIRRLHWRDRFNFVQATVLKIDLPARKVSTTAGVMEFDYLVIALGSSTNLSELPSVEKNIFTLKTLRDSILIRNHIIEVFEKASIEKNLKVQRKLLTFVVSGAGQIGVQVVSELRDCIFRTLIRFYKTIDPTNIRIILVEAGQRIMAEVHTKHSAYAMKQLEQMGIEIRLKSRITNVGKDQIQINSTEKIPSNTVIWVSGIVANKRIADLDAEKDSIGRISVTEYMEVPGFAGVYAVGDCINFEDPNTGQPIPARAHIAVRQARVVAHNILAEIRGKNMKPYHYSNIGEMISLGSFKAIFRFHALRLYGFPARIIWLVGYTTLITGTHNRIRIIIDWLLSIVFGRDTTFLRLN